jgi:hypothetical protein
VSKPTSAESDAATPAMLEDKLLQFSFPAVERRKVTAAFDGGRITSDGGVMLLAAAERELGIAERLAPLISDPRNPLLVTHSVADILRARMLAIACGYEDADDLDHLRTDPGFKLACGRLPDSGTDLCSQPTVSRWENAPTLREVVRMTYAMIDTYCSSYARAPRAVTLDIDDTLKFAEVQLADRSQCLRGRAVLKAVRQVFQPGRVLNLRLHESGDMVGPSVGPAARIGRPAHADDRHAGCPRRTVPRLALGVGHGCFTDRFAWHGFHSEA